MCSGTTIRTLPEKNSPMASEQQEGPLLSPEEDETSEIRKLPRSYDEQRKNIHIRRSRSQDLSGSTEGVKELGPLLGRARTVEQNSLLSPENNKKIICCSSPFQTKPITRSRKHFQKLYIHLGAITGIQLM